MKVHGSARKHGIDPKDAIHAAEHAVFVSDLEDDSPARQHRLRFDTGTVRGFVTHRRRSGPRLAARLECGPSAMSGGGSVRAVHGDREGSAYLAHSMVGHPAQAFDEDRD